MYIVVYCLEQVRMCCVNEYETRSWELTRKFKTVTASLARMQCRGASTNHWLALWLASGARQEC